MSEGITPYDFVQQVYYMQEKTLLDFWPNDDKYREVLVEANLVLRELEAQQDWTWLRETQVLGEMAGGRREIVEFQIPPDVYKLSMLNHDSIRLYPAYRKVTETVDDEEKVTYELNERALIRVPIASAGDQRWNREQQVNSVGVNHIHDPQLRAVVHGDKIKINRTLLPFESRCIAVVDFQKHIKPFHVCDPMKCHVNPQTHLCPDADEVYLTEVPDPNYVIMATAARHAEGSPPALARVAGLQDMAQRILSQMRQNDTDATDSDYIEWDVPGYIELV